MLRACTICGRPSDTSRCSAHQQRTRRAAKPSARHGSTRSYRVARRRALDRDDHTCGYCASPATEVDHIVPVALGGKDNLDNLVAACRPCNRTKGDSTLRPRPIIAVVGEIATGKTTVATQLADTTGWRYFAIDDYRQARKTWTQLLDDLARHPGPAIVESVLVPPAYRYELIRSVATWLHVDCPESERRARLTARAEPMPTDLRHRYHAHFRVDGTVPMTNSDAIITHALSRGLGGDPRPRGRTHPVGLAVQNSSPAETKNGSV
jgi:hypothetical protein